MIDIILYYDGCSFLLFICLSLCESSLCLPSDENQMLFENSKDFLFIWMAAGVIDDIGDVIVVVVVLVALWLLSSCRK